MFDIEFDITTREIFFNDGPSGDFISTTNPSVQNGGILLYARTPNLTNPILGIGIEQIMNSNSANATFEMNRWKAQAVTDGATIATWEGTQIAGGLDIKESVNYLPLT